MNKYKRILIILNLVLLICFFGASVMRKESILEDGKLLLLELAPVDPRSLMQGDYMELRYAITGNQGTYSLPKRGYCVVRPASTGVANLVRFQPGREPLGAGEYLINYTRMEWRLNIGADAYFFEEGTAEKYANARYGGIKVDADGNSLLVGLYGEDLKKIE